MDEINFLRFLDSRGIQRQMKLHISVIDSDNESFHSIENMFRRTRTNRSHRVNGADNDNDNNDNDLHQPHRQVTGRDQLEQEGDIQQQHHHHHQYQTEHTELTRTAMENDSGDSINIDDEEYDNYDNESSSLEEDQQIFDFLSLERDNDDADTFYRDRRESFNNGIEYDDEDVSDEEFLQGDEIFNRYEYHPKPRTLPPRSNSNNSNNIIINNISQETIVHHRSSYEELELHDDAIREHLQINGGLIDPFNPEYTQIDPSNHYQLVKLSPHRKYPNSLNIDFKYTCKLDNHEFVRKYKNNLSSIITNQVNNQSYLVNASNSEIMVYDFDPMTKIPSSKPLVKFDTKPFFTSTSDRLLSTWPYFPHTINYLKTDYWLDQQVLGICVDDGSILIYYVESLLSQIDKLIKNRNNNPNSHRANLFNIKINPDLKIKLESSAWGLDFLQYKDPVGNPFNVLVTSDNSQSLTLFIYNTFDGRFYHIKSHQLLHNIPHVSFLSQRIEGDLHEIKASCCSISGELIIFKFKFYPVAGPLNKGLLNSDEQQEEHEQEGLYGNNQFNGGVGRTYFVDSGMEQLELGTDVNAFDMFKRYFFYQPRVINRVLLREDCWTTLPIHKKFFSQQHSLNLTLGDAILSNKAELSRIIGESNLFDSLHNKDSNLGIATNWQYFECPVLNLNRDSYNHELHPKLTTIDDDYRRINKQFDKFKLHMTQDQSEHVTEPEDNDHFIVVSTSKKVGLFNANSLFCNSSTPTIFNVNIPFNEESKFTNRISITQIIPELSCYIAVTQQGLVSIFRLCQHRGVYGLRQEFLLPNAIALSLTPNGYRTIIGLSTKNVSPLSEHVKFMVYISYSDGLLLAYELSNPSGTITHDYSL